MTKVLQLRHILFRLEEIFQKFNHRPLLPLEEYVHAAIEWLLRAQRATPDDGVAQGYHVLTREWGASYPETTGYIIPSLLRAAAAGFHQPIQLREAAQKMGLWLLTTQMKSGAFPGGTIACSDPHPAVFNTGQILKGLTDLIGERSDDCRHSLMYGAERAAEWLMECQDEDGAWRRGISKLTSEPIHAYNIRAAWALAQYGKEVGNEAAIRTCLRNAGWLYAHQDKDGWYPHMNFDAGVAPVTHSIAYTIRGMLEVGILCDKPEYVESAVRAAEKMRRLQDPETGLIPGQVGPGFERIVDWTSCTGNSQMAIIWYRIAEQDGDPKWMRAADLANRFNCQIQAYDLYHPNSARKGGLRGSVPGHRGYGKFWYMNWTQKFHLDALLAQMGATMQ